MASHLTLCILVVAAFVASSYSQCPIGRAPICPPDTGNIPIYFPHETNCAWYYVCTNGGVPVCNICPPPLLWDQNGQSCNHPGAVNCRNNV